MSFDPQALEPQNRCDWIARCLFGLVVQFDAHGLWYSLAYGTLLGALRDGDVIGWDYDFDVLIRPGDIDQILAWSSPVPGSGYEFIPTVHPSGALAMNPAGVTSFWTAAIGVFHDGAKVGDLYAFSLFSDGILRRWDFTTDVYWCPHSSFPAYFIESEARAPIRGRAFRTVRAPERWIAGIYGEDWRTPYRAVTHGGLLRDGVTIHGDRYEPKLAAETAWCESQGWDRRAYVESHDWPRRIGGAGPVGPTDRTRDNSRALWWRDLTELQAFF